MPSPEIPVESILSKLPQRLDSRGCVLWFTCSRYASNHLSSSCGVKGSGRKSHSHSNNLLHSSEKIEGRLTVEEMSKFMSSSH